MKLTVNVTAEGYEGRFFAGMDIPEPLMKAYEPLRITDDTALARMLGESVPSDARVKIVTKMREAAAREIADALTQLLITSMQSKDTSNGYPVTDKNPTN